MGMNDSLKCMASFLNIFELRPFTYLVLLSTIYKPGIVLGSGYKVVNNKVPAFRELSFQRETNNQ